ncbi:MULTISPECIES: LysR family transcriptional regulator [Streptomyces]|uniref:LysR substrate-binding domain-containing protein n=1 Tax=Streptomyces solicathayae TaxID=3081768 RepID=A0ABZ0M2W5_9ACTN|nr:LysR substrate-binding domain-containing protein [Streptomyces sp. HUAS YS2]WOX26125.1 LysR substrate-binding domain-containing protein [Streptomyces sp. HUAS YS2]
MELRRLQYFVAVVEEGGFTRAAARLHLSQPGLSAQIRQLEKELGQPLLDRSGRTVTPTEVGRAVLPYARAALAAVDGVRQTVDEYTGLLRGRVTLGIVSGAAGRAFELPALLADFRDAHPRVEISLTEDSSERMRAALLAGELDVALLGTADAEPPPGLAYRVVVDEPLVALVTGDHPLAVRGEVPLSDLRERSLICLPRGTGVRTVLERACAAAGFAPQVAFEAAAPQVLAQLAARGLGVAVLPWGEEPVPDGSLRAVRIVRPVLRGRVALAWRADGPASPAARAFLERLRDALPEAAG